MSGGKSFILILFLLVVPMCYGLTVNPSHYDVGTLEDGESYNLIITIINTGVDFLNVDMQLSEDSDYLEPYVLFDDYFVQLEPNGRENMLITINSSSDLSPGKHSLRTEFISSNESIAQTDIDFEIEGEKVHRLVLQNISVDAWNTETPIYFSLNIRNDGNVAEEVEPVMIISKYDEVLKRFDETGFFEIMPGEVSNLSLMFDPSEIETGGIYNAEIFLRYSNRTTKKINEEFFLKKVERKRGKEIITIEEGENIELPVNLENFFEGINFYKVEGEISPGNISGRVEGSFDDNKKIVILNMSTGDLDPGEYNLSVSVFEGREFDDVEKIEYVLQVERGILEKFLPLMLVILLVFVAVVLYIFMPSNRINLYFLDKKITRLDNSFDSIEKDIKTLDKDVKKFIKSSNEGLSRYKRGFK